MKKRQLILGGIGLGFLIGGCSSGGSAGSGGSNGTPENTDGQAASSSGSSSSGSASSGSSSASTSAMTSDGGGDTGAPTACSFNMTIQNLAFYGESDAGSGNGGSVCSGIVPPTSAIMAMPYMYNSSGEVQYGTPPDAWHSYSGQSPGQIAPTATLLQDGSFVIAGNLQASDAGTAHADVGLVFANSSCVDASQYEGITFTITGDFGGCTLRLQFIDPEDTSTIYGAGNLCTTTCVPPTYTITSTGVITIPFDQLAAGSPQAALDTASFVSLQWNFFLL